MVLTALRRMDSGSIPGKIECSDTDFDVALSVKLGKSIRTIHRQVRRAIQNGQVKELSKGRHERLK